MKKVLKILGIVIGIIALLVNLFFWGWDFRLRWKLDKWNSQVTTDVAYVSFESLYLNGEKVDINQNGWTKANGRVTKLERFIGVRIEDNKALLIATFHPVYQLVSYDIQEKTYEVLSSTYAKKYEGGYYRLHPEAGLNHAKLFEQLEIYKGGLYFLYEDSAVIQFETEAIVFDLETYEVNHHDGIFCPLDINEGMDFSSDTFTIQKDGIMIQKSLEDMALTCPEAKVILRMSKRWIPLFGPKVSYEISGVSQWGDKYLIELNLTDSGGWPYIINFEYDPITDTFEYLWWVDELEPVDINCAYMVPIIEGGEKAEVNQPMSMQ